MDALDIYHAVTQCWWYVHKYKIDYAITFATGVIIGVMI